MRATSFRGVVENAGVIVRGEAIAHAVGVEDDQVPRLELERLWSGRSHVLAEDAVVRDESCFGFAEAPEDGVSGAGVDRATGGRIDRAQPDDSTTRALHVLVEARHQTRDVGASVA